MRWGLIGAGDIVWSQENYALYDFDPAQVVPSLTDWESRVHPDDLAHANEMVRNAVEGKSPEFRSEFRVVRRDGTVTWLLGLGRVQRDASGAAIRLSGINIDITASKESEAQLRESEERYRAATTAVSDVIWTNNAEGLMAGEQRGWGDC